MKKHAFFYRTAGTADRFCCWQAAVVLLRRKLPTVNKRWQFGLLPIIGRIVSDISSWRISPAFFREKSQNTIVVSLYGSGEWSQAYSFVDYIKLGSLEMACLKPAEMLRLQPAYELYQQPYLFTSLQAVESYISGDAGKKHCRHCLLRYYGIGFVPDGYQYLLDDGQPQWLSYGELKLKRADQSTGRKPGV